MNNESLETTRFSALSIFGYIEQPTFISASQPEETYFVSRPMPESVAKLLRRNNEEE